MKEEQVEENAEESGFEHQSLALKRGLPLTIAAELYESLRHTESVYRRLDERRTEVFQAFDSLPVEDHPLAFGMFLAALWLKRGVLTTLPTIAMVTARTKRLLTSYCECVVWEHSIEQRPPSRALSRPF